MKTAAAKTLRDQVLCRPMIVGLVILGAIAVVVLQLIRGYVELSTEVRAYEVARSIDHIALLVATPGHLQHVVDTSAENGVSASILLVRKSDDRIIAANQQDLFNRRIEALSDAELSRAVQGVMRDGIFGTYRLEVSQRRFIIVPLTADLHSLSGDAGPGHTAIREPVWHSTVGIVPNSFWQAARATWLAALGRQSKLFTVDGGRYSGVIVVELRQDWMVHLLQAAFVGVIGLLLAGLLVMTLVSFRSFQRFVSEPLDQLSSVLRKMRQGHHNVRAPRTGIKEFDNLCTQWNTLLDERDKSDKHNRVLSKVLEYAPVGIEVSTPQASIEYANPAYQEMTGYQLFEMIGKTPEQLIRSDRTPPAVWDEVETAIGEGRIWHGEVISRRRDGGEFTCQLTLCPIVDGNGAVERIVAVRVDITDHKIREQELIDARLKAESSDRAKTEFIAKVSHELRTPLNSVIGFANMLSSETLGPLGSEQYRDFAGMIEHSATGLLGVINSIIELSKMQAHEMELDETTFAPGPALEHIVNKHMAPAERNGVTIHLEQKSRTTHLHADERGFRRLMEVLLSNAIKFNVDGGRIDVILRRDYKRRLVIEIKDTGIGIPEDELESVTEAFYQADGGHARAYEGVGLGLTLARHVVEAHDGQMEISSPDRQGTLVKVTFPAERTIVAWPPKRRSQPRRQTARSVDAA